MRSRNRTMMLCGLMLCSSLLAGCGLTQKVGKGTARLTKAIFVKKVDPLHLQLTARSALNTDDADMSSPVEVRIWPLHNTAAFNQADYQALLRQAPQVLANDLTGKPVIIRVTPGNSVTRDIPLSDETQAVAIAAFFLTPDLQKNNWRLVIARDDMEADDPSIVELRDRELLLQGKE